MCRALTYIRLFSLVLFAFSLAGCSSSGSGKLAALFTADSSTSPVAPFTVSFDAGPSTGKISGYIWDFGDGTNGAQGRTTQHQFNQYGVFTVTLTVSDSAGTASTSMIITVGSPVTLSGTITSQAGSVQDSDVNDPNSPFASNDSVATAQGVSNPVIIGGYASATGSGVGIDRFASVGDVFDVYRARLGANQTIRLSVSDATPGNNLDLYLFDGDSASLFNGSCDSPLAPRDFSQNDFPNKFESVVVPEDGDFYIAVCAVQGWSNYVMTIGNTTVLNIANVDTQDDFIPGELIVKFSDTAQLSGLSLQQQADTMGMLAKGGSRGNPMLFGLGDENRRKAVFTRLGIPQRKQTGKQSGSSGISKARRLKEDTITVLKALRQRSDVQSADLNYIRKPLATPSDAQVNDQWHYGQIDLPSAWDLLISPPPLAPTPADVVVAVVDTGALTAHEDLAGNLVAGYDFITSPTNANDGDGRDPDPSDPGGDTPGGGSSSFHGTHVAGTIAAVSDNGIGVAGVTWNTNTKVMPIRVLGVNGGTSFDIMEGVKYAAGLANSEESATQTAARVASGNVAQVINLSLGGGSFSQTEQDVFTLVRNAGVIVVAASGNSSTDAPSYPASYEGVVSVGAVARADVGDPALASYSNTGPALDLVAPGGDGDIANNADNVLSTSGDDSAGGIVAGYRYLRGTSMASPHVAGVAALIKSVHATLTPGDFDILLQAGVITDDLAIGGPDGPSVRNNEFGFGQINALKAVSEGYSLATGGDLPPFLSINPSLINFLEPVSEVIITTSNPGGGTLTIDTVSVEKSSPWLSVSELVVDPTTRLGTYTVSVNRNALANAQYQDSIVFTYSGDITGNVSIPVSMQVGPLSTTGDTGFQYAFLVDFDVLLQNDPTQDPTVQQVTLGSPVSGEYNFSFANVIDGNYVILAGSDQDNDLFLCDAGEACGLYPFVISPQGVNIPGLNFISRYDNGVGTTAGMSPSGFSRQGPAPVINTLPAGVTRQQAPGFMTISTQ